MPRPSFSPLVQTLTTAAIALIAATQPAQAAERIYLTYGLLERSVGFEGLKQYAETGELDDDLFVYTSYVSPEQRQQLRSVLQSKADLDPVSISQFLYSPQGELLLKRLGQVIQPEARTDGSVAIRAALILAAADKTTGLTPLNVIAKFPTRGIRVDLQSTLRVAGELERIISETKKYVTAVTDQADREATPPPNSRIALDLSNRGRIGFDVTSLTLTDSNRAAQTGISTPRTFPVDIYLPRTPSRANIPVVIISHGLGSDRTTFKYLATHLASHGFAVLIPEHPGSNGKQITDLLRGLAQEVAEPSEFVNRPFDIRYLLDTFSNDPRYRNLNFKQVGIVGQSFGAYTALSLSGAPLSFENLAKECTEEKLLNTFNVSLTLQCRATQLEPRSYALADPRIAAAIAINPFSSAVHGKTSLEQIQVPTMIISGGSDTVAPSVPEQIFPFTWLKNRDRYLVMVDQGSHFSFLEDAPPGGGSIPVPPEVIGPSPAQARRYMSTIGLAFFRTYLTDQKMVFKSFLSSSYVKSISDPSLPIALVTQFDPKSATTLKPKPTPTPNPTLQTMPVPTPVPTPKTP
jgi:predicted dienelactone hydrolase